MKLTDLIISGILKKGILYEARAVDTEIDVPFDIDGQERRVTIKFKCENMSVRIEKESKEA